MRETRDGLASEDYLWSPSAPVDLEIAEFGLRPQPYGLFRWKTRRVVPPMSCSLE